MKKLSMIVFLIALTALLGGWGAAQAADTVLIQNSTITMTSPMETSAVGYWFPGDGAFAAGIAHTILRVVPTSVPKLSFDVDATIAQEVTADKSTLGGLGFKVGYNMEKADKTGLNFIPSIGFTALNDFAKYKTAGDIFGHYRIAVYGTALLYKW